MLRFVTAGESHGPCLAGIIEGMPAGVNLDSEEIDKALELRKRFAGRGPRAHIEKDSVEILSGVAEGRTTGAPICLKIKNFEQKLEHASSPRPGHADLPGMLKYGFSNLHLVAERASARETAMRVAAGTAARLFLRDLGLDFLAHTLGIGKVRARGDIDGSFNALRRARNGDPLGCLDTKASLRMQDVLDAAEKMGDTLGGVTEVLIQGAPPGLGSHVHWDRRLDGLLARGLMSIPSVKAVEIGQGVDGASKKGSRAHDALYWKEGKGIFRKTNRAGGIEGGISNGEVINARIYVKPVPTLRKPLPTVDAQKGGPSSGLYVRSDVCIVPSLAVIAEAVASWTMGVAVVEKFGGDTVGDTRMALDAYRKRIRPLFFSIRGGRDKDFLPGG